jgi:sirohydrochlorin ferrochelatase
MPDQSILWVLLVLALLFDLLTALLAARAEQHLEEADEVLLDAEALLLEAKHMLAELEQFRAMYEALTVAADEDIFKIDE